MISINIPQERKPIVIGKDCEIKADVEHRTKTKIKIGKEIEIEGDPESEAKASELVKAIGRGFSPHVAYKLLDEEVLLDVITIKGTPNTIKRLMSRIIGTQGKAKKNIERLTDASIAVYGKTVSIIGNYKEINKARSAIEMLIAGRTHSHVWRQLERRR